jgi:diguanylate cyclase (GGDEF)-like protein
VLSTTPPLESGPSQPDTAADGALVALLAVARLLATAAGDSAADEVHASLVREARTCFGAGSVLVLAQEPGRRLRVLAGDAAPGALTRPIDIDAHRSLAELLDRRLRLLRADGARARDLCPLLEAPDPPPGALLLLLRATDGLDGALVLTGLPAGPMSSVDVDVATAFADAGAAALDRLKAIAEHERQVAQQEALTRAAKTLNESLDLETVLGRICQEAATILGSDVATVYRGSAEQGLEIAAAFGMGPEAVGYRLPTGTGLAGKVVLKGQAMLTNDYQRIAALPRDAPFGDAHSAMAAPMVWDGELRGVLSIGYTEARGVGHEDLTVLETFAELAATACANASAHAGLALVARTDGLTGCLNHAALHEGLAREIERAMRTDAPALSLVLVDLDDFKQVNETHGHLVGDEVLRRAGHALRHATRPYDLAARYGGDEFALLTAESTEDEAAEIAQRALERVGEAIQELLPQGGTAGTAGVAQWSSGVSATELIARADRALLFAKQEGFRGGTMAFSAVPDHFRPGRFNRHDRNLPEPPPMPTTEPRAWPDGRVDDRLRKRTRQLALANELGARLAGMTDPAEILDATVDELHRAFGYFCVAMIRIRADATVEAATLRGAPFLRLMDQRWTQSLDVGLIGRCLRTRRAVISDDVTAEPEYRPTAETQEVRSEMIAPLWVGDDLWGAINVEELEPGAFDQDDLLLLQTVAAQVGSAMRSAMLYERLERAYLGTAEALAAALEAKDAYTADHARSIVEQAEAVGRALGLDEGDLRDLRFAAVFHDIGKIAIPEAILHKDGPLDAGERAIMERHTIVGEQILAPVEFLAGVRRLVRHEHERWDGRGYPDGLAGDDIPLGSRIILACDALHAMTSDRPYRRAMSFERAIEEIRAQTGTQFDPQVIEALLRLLDV